MRGEGFFSNLCYTIIIVFVCNNGLINHYKRTRFRCAVELYGTKDANVTKKYQQTEAVTQTFRSLICTCIRLRAH